MKHKQRLTVRMPSELNVILTNVAKDTGVSKNSLVLQILWEKVKFENQNKNL